MINSITQNDVPCQGSSIQEEDSSFPQWHLAFGECAWGTLIEYTIFAAPSLRYLVVACAGNSKTSASARRVIMERSVEVGRSFFGDISDMQVVFDKPLNDSKPWVECIYSLVAMKVTGGWQLMDGSHRRSNEYSSCF